MLIGLVAVPMAWSDRDRLGRSTSGTLLPDTKIVAVLPFRVIGAGKEEGLYSEGVSVVLTSNLAQLGVPNLQVMPASEIREARIDTVEKARAELGATLVLAGVVQFSGGQVRVSYSLIRTADRRELSARSKTLAAGDPFALQDVVTRDVLTMLETGPAAAPQEPRQVFGTRDDRAFFLYTQARGRHAELPRAGERGRGHQAPDRSRRPGSAVCRCVRRPGADPVGELLHFETIVLARPGR